MIDPDMKELAETLKGMKTDSNTIPIGWASFIGILLVVFGALFGGWASNRIDITTLQSQTKTIISWQDKMDPIITAIRDDQVRRQMKEGDK